MTAQVIQLPVVRTCFVCVHHTEAGPTPSHCRLFDEPIDSELFAARHCSSYEPA